jgi:hypothetical protein
VLLLCGLQIYLVVLTVRILLSWFRTIDWYTEPWNTLRQVRQVLLLAWYKRGGVEAWVNGLQWHACFVLLSTLSVAFIVR